VERREAEAVYDAGRERCVDFILALAARYERLEARVEKLEEQLRRSSRNSSLPPSQDPPSAPPRPGKPSSSRGRGGQLGHEGRHRPLLPLEPSFPAEVPPGAFGPRLQAAVATLAVRNRVSRRDTVELADELFGVELSSGSIDAIVHRAGEALAELRATRIRDREPESRARRVPAAIFPLGPVVQGAEFQEGRGRLRLPAKGDFTIYSMWPESQEVATAGASLRLDVGVDPALNIGVPKVTLALGVSLGGGFHADVEGRFLIFKEWKRLRATVQAKGIAGRAAEWLLEKPRRFIGNVEFLVVVLTPKGLQHMTLRVDGEYWLKDRLLANSGSGYVQAASEGTVRRREFCLTCWRT
jgi:hypothetical protein